MICDTHNDFPTKLKGKSFFNYLNYCEKAGVEILIASIYTTEMHNPLCTMQNIIHNIQNYKGQIKLLIHIEDLGFLQNEDDLNTVIALKPFSCGIVWNNENIIATKNGLTPFGKLAVKKLVKNKILVDLAHANKKTFYDAVKIIKHNIFVSHTAFEAVCSSTRNIDDRQIRKIIKSKGFIGLYLVRKFVGGDSLEPHIIHAEKIGGKKFIGIGTDYFGTRDIIAGHKKYEYLIQNIDNNDVLYKNFIDYLARLKKKHYNF